MAQLLLLIITMPFQERDTLVENENLLILTSYYHSLHYFPSLLCIRVPSLKLTHPIVSSIVPVPSQV